MIRQQKYVSILVDIIKILTGIRLYTRSDIQTALLYSLNNFQKSTCYESVFDAGYYQNLHENNTAFQKNNWLLDELEEIKKPRPRVVSELACGNALFSKEIARFCSKVYAIDWAEAPSVNNLPNNVIFLKRDIVCDDLPKADLACSGDFLEHLPTNTLQATIEKIIASSPLGYHKVACYDDGHSHLSILPPWQWLQFFQNVDKEYKIKKVEFRRDDFRQTVVVISNY